MISVIIPLYNKAATIERAINSVLNQTVQDFELIVVNNGSTDGGEEVVKRKHDPRLRIIEQDNLGVSMARNRGIAESKYELVAFLDADDEWHVDFLQTVLQLSEKYPNCDVFATAYQRCNAEGEIKDIHLNHVPNQEEFVFDNYFEVASLSDPPFCSISVMIKKEALLAIGGFPKGVHQGEDLLTWARLASKYKIAYNSKSRSTFYTSENSSMDKPKRIPATEDIVGQELEKIFQQNPSIPGLRQYIAYWHKMRASIYLRLPNSSRRCRAEVHKSQHWNRTPKMILYMFLSFLPYSIRMSILKRLK